jgi:hypothetical protein
MQIVYGIYYVNRSKSDINEQQGKLNLKIVEKKKSVQNIVAQARGNRSVVRASLSSIMAAYPCGRFWRPRTPSLVEILREDSGI